MAFQSKYLKFTSAELYSQGPCETCVALRAPRGCLLSVIQESVDTKCAVCKVIFAAVTGFIVPKEGQVAWGNEFRTDEAGNLAITYENMYPMDSIRIIFESGLNNEEHLGVYRVDYEGEGQAKVMTILNSFQLRMVASTVGSDLARGTALAPFFKLNRHGWSTAALDVDSCSETIKEWLHDCGSSHSNCTAVQNKPLPRRLIFVGEKNSIRLCNTSGMEGRYISLSYCWGAFVGIKTTKATLDEHLSNIDFDELPKTFKDAIKLTRSLAIDYIWIDSLCIIQGDNNDWLLEAALMAQTYANSILNLSVVSSVDPTEGFFGERHRFNISTIDSLGIPPVLSPFPWITLILIQEDSETIAAIFVGEIYYHGILDDDHEESWNLRGKTPSPLFKRAWTFQERLLSPRIVHFTSQEMMWECSSGVGCECGKLQVGKSGIYVSSHWTTALNIYNNLMRSSDDTLDTGFTLREQVKSKFSQSMQDARMSKLTENEIRVLWEVMVELYSQRNITFDTDRLMALSALARSMQCGQLGQYLAGMWAKSLPEALVWRSVGKKGRRASRYRAPSWSWASLDSPVTYSSPSCSKRLRAAYTSAFSKIDASILRTTFTPADPNNTYSDATSCSITFSAPINVGYLQANDHCPGFEWVGSEFVLARGELRLGFTADVFDEIASEVVEGKIECITLMIGESQDGISRALVLRKAEANTGQFKRIGMLKSDKDDYETYSSSDIDATIWTKRLKDTLDAWFYRSNIEEITVI